MVDKNILFNNLKKIHTTKMGYERISRNLEIKPEEVVYKCIEKICNKESVITKQGKNWYVEDFECKITINAYSYTIITAHKKEKTKWKN